MRKPMKAERAKICKSRIGGQFEHSPTQAPLSQHDLTRTKTSSGRQSHNKMASVFSSGIAQCKYSEQTKGERRFAASSLHLKERDQLSKMFILPTSNILIAILLILPLLSCQTLPSQYASPPPQIPGQLYDQLINLLNQRQQQQQALAAARQPQLAQAGLSAPQRPVGLNSYMMANQQPAQAQQQPAIRRPSSANFQGPLPAAGSQLSLVTQSSAYLPLNRVANQQTQLRPSVPIPLGNQAQPMAHRDQRPAARAQPAQLSRSQALPVRPVSGGFAPSGPPPSQIAANNALTVVTSPPNATGRAAIEPTLPTANKSDAPVESGSTETTPLSSTFGSSAAETTLPSTTTEKMVEISSKQDANWAPLDAANVTTEASLSTSTRLSLAPSPDIVTVPPGYNPDNPTPPQNYDIPVSAQMGMPPGLQRVKSPTNSSTSLVAPTAVTTIIWSPPVSTSTSSPPAPSAGVQTSQLARPVASQAPAPQPSRIRDSSSLATAYSSQPDQEVVYGKAQARGSQPVPPPISASPTANLATIESSVSGQAGRPFIQPVQIDNQVRPFASGAQQKPVGFRSSRPLNGSPMHVGSGFTIVANGNQTMPSGDIQDYVAGQPPFMAAPSGPNSEPTVSAQGGQDPATFDLSAQDSMPPSNSSSSEPPQQVSSSSPPPALAPRTYRKPTFKPKPAVPPIRIDSCIVGDDSSCDQGHNERCVTEYGISSCHCRPGFARLSQMRGYCDPVSLVQLTIKIDKLSDERRLAFNQSLENPNSEEYQYLEFETIQALTSAFRDTSLFEQFRGARVNKFFERRGKVHVNVSLSLMLNQTLKNERSAQSLVGQELAKVSQQRTKPLGESTIVLDGSRDTISRLADVNECSSKELNDCSKFATCTNDFGGFHCQCMAGYDDKHAGEPDRSKQGRTCLGCSASYCSNRGECSIVEGQKQCKCRPSFIGARCDIDSEVLAVAVGGSIVGIVILVVTFWCLFVFNRRWKREQQKMDAMSATSGLTYNYVNSSTNSLMSPARAPVGTAGGLHRSGGHHQALGYGRAFVNTGRAGALHYPSHNDQQAMIGSTSSGSSQASQPLACNPYAGSGSHHHLHNAYQSSYPAAHDEAGLLIAPVSGGSSEQTSPGSGASYRPQQMVNHMAAGSAYTLSGHHHHHHHLHQLNQSQHLQLMHGKQAGQLSQFQADPYRTLNQQHCPQAGEPARWRTLQQQQQDPNKGVIGYYLVR